MRERKQKGIGLCDREQGTTGGMKLREVRTIGSPITTLDNPVHAVRRLDLLSQGGYARVRKYRCVECIDAFPWCC